MSLTLGLTGMDPATETALRAAFVDANARLGGHWTLVPDAEAGHVVVDMDSMYGRMSWLRLHAAGRQVIGLSSAPRTQTDYRLGRPFDTAQMMALLAEVAAAAGVELEERPVADAAASLAEPTAEAVPAATAEAVPEPTAEPAPAVAAGVEPADEAVAAQASDAGPEAEEEAEPAAPIAAPPPIERTLAYWLQPGALSGRRRLARSGVPVVLIDADADSWYGPATLKPLAALFEGSLDDSDFETPDDDDWTRESGAAGAAQPLVRLRWLGGLLAGGGALLPGLDPDGRYQLNKWPQTEREYPRHFRIATQMMKGPATPAEIAAGSGVPVADVADFINANVATGFAEPTPEAPPVAAEPPRPRGGLLGRLRVR